jgi:integrase
MNRWVDLLESDPDDPPKAKTIADYRFKLRYVDSLLGTMALAEIKPDHVDDALRLIRNLLWRVIEDAAQREYIMRNPVLKPRRGKKKRNDAKGREVYRLTLAQAAMLIEVLAHRPEALAWWLVVLLGLREGEVLGLERADLDLVICSVTIDEQYTQLKGRAHHSTTKTPHSDRILPFPRALVPAFEALIHALNIRAKKAMRRGTWQEHQLLFPGAFLCLAGESNTPRGHSATHNRSPVGYTLPRALAARGCYTAYNTYRSRCDSGRYIVSRSAATPARGILSSLQKSTAASQRRAGTPPCTAP